MTEAWKCFESRAYRFALGLSRLILLNLAWAVASLPVVTFIPATVAMFGVVREWRRGDEPNVFPSFVRHFRANFRQAFGIGLLWLITAVVLVLDYQLAGQLPGPAQLPFLVLTTIVVIAFALTSVYLCPVMVEYQADWKALIRNSFLISLSQLHTSVAALAVVAGGAISRLAAAPHSSGCAEWSRLSGPRHLQPRVETGGANEEHGYLTLPSVIPSTSIL